MNTLNLTGRDLTIDGLAAFLDAEGQARVSIDPAAAEAVARCAHFREQLSLGDANYYGINTGFGRFATRRVDASEASQLQENLLRSHAVGMGPSLSVEIVRLMMLLRANSLVEGYSGVSLELVSLLVEMINRGVTPVVPTYGSVGASGDLAPLAHMALPLIGEGDVEIGGERMPAAAGLERVGLSARSLEPKEGLALINGTQLMSAFAVREIVRGRRLLKTAMGAAAMSLEAYQATDRIFDARIHNLKRHPGGRRLAEGFRRLHAGSALIKSHRDCDRVQDPYSFRCIPQVLGAVVDTLEWVETWVTREINAVTDNPLLFPGEGDVLSGGNFHGEHMAIALDTMAIAFAEVASIAERRIDKLIDSDCDALPRCLVKDPGLNSGLMITQYLAAALVSENKITAHPASVDSIPTSMGFEDHVSMGSISAIKLPRIIDNATRVVAIELLCGAQALDFHLPLVPGRGVAAVRNAVRETVPFLEKDTILATYLSTLEARVETGDFYRAAESAVGELLTDDH